MLKPFNLWKLHISLSISPLLYTECLHFWKTAKIAPTKRVAKVHGRFIVLNEILNENHYTSLCQTFWWQHIWKETRKVQLAWQTFYLALHCINMYISFALHRSLYIHLEQVLKLWNSVTYSILFFQTKSLSDRNGVQYILHYERSLKWQILEPFAKTNVRILPCARPNASVIHFNASVFL